MNSEESSVKDDEIERNLLSNANKLCSKKQFKSAIEKLKGVKSHSNKAKARDCEKKCLRESLKSMFVGIHDRAQFRKLIRRQVRVEEQFFDPRRTESRETHQLSAQLLERRLSNNEMSSLEFGDERFPPSRRIITAERAIIQSSIELYNWSEVHRGWSKTTRKTLKGQFCHKEAIKIGKTQIKYSQKATLNCNNLGDYYMYDVGSYEWIIGRLNLITGSSENAMNSDNEVKIVSLMLRFLHDGQSVTLDGLRAINKNANCINVNEMNRIFYHCLVKEVARRMLPKDETHKLPFALAHSRALKLAHCGHLSLKDLFSQFAPFGIFTDKYIGSNIKGVEDKINRINDLYSLKICANRKYLTSSNDLYSELKQTYGGENDSDQED